MERRRRKCHFFKIPVSRRGWVEKSSKLNREAIQEGNCQILYGNVMELPFESLRAGTPGTEK